MAGQLPPGPDTIKLQKALTTFAQSTGFTLANPGRIDGIIDLKTVGAVVAVIPKVPGLPSEIRDVLPFLYLAAQYDTGTADRLITLVHRYAAAIAKAVIAVGVHTVVTGGAPQPPAPGGGKASWALVSDAASTGGFHVYTPPGATGGGPLTSTIWFYDRWKRTYRVAVPRGTLAGEYKNYVEIAPSVARPAGGTEVSRSAFFSAVGQWWMTTPGMIAMGAGAIVLGGAAFYTARTVLR